VYFGGWGRDRVGTSTYIFGELQDWWVWPKVFYVLPTSLNPLLKRWAWFAFISVDALWSTVTCHNVKAWLVNEESIHESTQNFVCAANTNYWFGGYIYCWSLLTLVLCYERKSHLISVVTVNLGAYRKKNSFLSSWHIEEYHQIFAELFCNPPRVMLNKYCSFYCI